jgi:hypothetical protein
MLGDARRCSAMLGDARRCSAMLGDARRCSGAARSVRVDHAERHDGPLAERSLLAADAMPSRKTLRRLTPAGTIAPNGPEVRAP